MRNTIVPTSRQVIESKLMTALEDSQTVAILLNEKDLCLLISALVTLGCASADEMAKDLRELKKAAFK